MKQKWARYWVGSKRDLAISLKRGPAFYLAVVLLSLGLPLLATFSTANTTGSTRTKTAAGSTSPAEDDDSQKPHVMAASYYSVVSNLKTTLKLNNKGPQPLEVQPSLYNLSGERFDPAPITVPPTSFRIVDMRELVLQSGPGFEEGSLELFYRGHDLMLGAQIKMVDEQKSIGFDEQLYEPAVGYGSSRLEGLWWLPARQGDVRLVLSNRSDKALSVNVWVTGVAPEGQSEGSTVTVVLGPHETRVLDLSKEITLHSGGGKLFEVGAISIEHSGESGALLARGMAEVASRGYSTVIEFSDPAKAKSSMLHGAGLRLGRAGKESVRPIIVARNIAKTPTELTGRIPFTDINGDRQDAAIANTVLKPGELRLIEAPSVNRPAASAGLEFEYSGAPGSVIISSMSVSGSANQVFKVPLLDPAAQRSSTGGYPWIAEGTSSTIVYVKNVSKKSQEYVLELRYSGGAYTLGIEKLVAGETAAIDIADLRNRQVPDENGNVIPLDINEGQVHWSVRGLDDLVVIGRAEHVDLASALSSTYACQNCCGNSFDNAFCTPGSVLGPVGGMQQFLPKEQDHDCYGNLLTPFSVSASSWGSDDTSVATVNGSGMATAQGPGTTSIRATFTAYVRHLTGFPTYCVTEAITGPFAAATCQVNPTVWLSGTVFSPDTIQKQNGMTTFTVSVAASTGVPPGTMVLLEAFQFQNVPGVQLTIAPANGQNGGTVSGGQTANIMFEIATTQTNDKTGDVFYRGRILSVVSGNPNVTVEIGPVQPADADRKMLRINP